MNRPAIASTLSFAGWAALVAAGGLAAAWLAGAEAVRGAADALVAGGWMRSLPGAAPGDARIAGIAAALPEAAGAALAFGAALLAFRRPIARSLVSGPAVEGGRSAGAGRRVEAVLAACVVGACAALAARNLDLPIRSDEARNVVQFASQPFGAILGDYRDPNNHVLHTLLVRAAHQLLGASPAALRAPAFLAACLTLPAVWWFVRREYGWLAAGFATALVGASPLFIEYAANARGYTLLCLLFMALLLCGQGLVRRPDDHGRWGRWAAVAALGFFTTPIMAFPAAITAVWMLLATWRERGAAGLSSFAVRGAWWCAAAAALTLLLYAPALMVSGVDAVFFNKGVQPGGAGVPAVLANAPRSWLAWHAATPVWAQAALLLALLVGAMAPRRRPSGPRGLLALAVVLGMGAVFLVKPVALSHRHTLFLLLATMIVAGAGAAFLVEAAFTRLRSSPGLAGRWTRREGIGALAVLAVLGCFSWWATRPGVAEHFAWETGWSPNASALAAAVDAVLRSGDYVLGGHPTMYPVAFHLRGLGREARRVRGAGADELGRFGLRHTGPWRFLDVYRVGGSGPPDAAPRFHLVVDEAGNRSAGPPLRRRTGGYWPQYVFEDDAGGSEAIASLPGAKVYRLRPRPGGPAPP